MRMLGNVVRRFYGEPVAELTPEIRATKYWQSIYLRANQISDLLASKVAEDPKNFYMVSPQGHIATFHGARVQSPPTVENCKNCGARYHAIKCDYCGTPTR